MDILDFQLSLGFYKLALIHKSFAEFYNMTSENSFLFDNSNYYEIMRRAILLNDQEYKESYLKDDVITNDFKLSDIGVEGTIPEGKYLVLGDNRTNSLDGRNYGLIEKNRIVGISWFRIWPIK